jgi:hypothetical protein
MLSRNRFIHVTIGAGLGVAVTMFGLTLKAVAPDHWVSIVCGGFVGAYFAYLPAKSITSILVCASIGTIYGLGKVLMGGDHTAHEYLHAAYIGMMIGGALGWALVTGPIKRDHIGSK